MATMAVQAHRGSPDPASGIGENTLAAFARARDLGADGVELDVRLTADGALAVHHDPVVEGGEPIADRRAADLPPSVPLLADALDACEGLRVNIEIKNLPAEPGFDPDHRVAGLVADLVMATDRVATVVVSSFWPDTLEAVHRACPELATGLLVAHWPDPLTLVPVALARRCTALHPFVTLVSGPLVAAAHDAGLSLAAWTVNDPTQLTSMDALGVDTVITDDVALALAVRSPRA
jgi:glycerophosphoryl diester phosphodiesterase